MVWGTVPRNLAFKVFLQPSQQLWQLLNTLFFFLCKFIYLFLAALGLCCCVPAFSSCDERGTLFATVCRLLIAVVSPVVEHRLQARGLQLHRLSSCGTRALERRLSSGGAQAQLLRSTWDLPGLGLEPVSPAFAGGFLTTAPPGKSLNIPFCKK